MQLLTQAVALVLFPWVLYKSCSLDIQKFKTTVISAECANNTRIGFRSCVTVNIQDRQLRDIHTFLIVD